jgi:hypothetical protein
MFCSSCGKEVPADKSFCTNCGTPAPVDTDSATAPVTAPVAPQVQGGGPARPKRTGVIVGSVLAVVVVLAGAGVGLWLGLRGDGGTDGGSVTTVVDGSGTPATVPGLDGTEGATDSTAPGGAEATYRSAVRDLVGLLEYDNGRIPELADIINSSTPDIPQAVLDELRAMYDDLLPAYEAVTVATPPPAFAEANTYLIEATEHMMSRIGATIDGVQATLDSGHTSSATPYYSEGRDQRDAYLAAMEQFNDALPGGVLP